MSIRCILVPINGHPADKAVLETAYALGTTFGAHIAVACLRPDPKDILRYAGDWPAPSILGSAVALAEKHSLAVSSMSKAIFEQWRKEHDLPIAEGPSSTTGISVSWAVYLGPSTDMLADIARFYDLVVMRTLGDQGPIDGDLMLETILFDVGRPALLVPHEVIDIFAGSTLIAWDGEQEALRAVVEAMPLLRRSRDVQILTVDTTEATRAECLASYLAWHGIAATVSDVVRESHSVGEVVLAEGKRLKASLLVMGGYHHGRTRELLFGGTTRRIIATTATPVLLAR
jgi:nucleotide-binding universal stress UspA family protein